MAALLRREKGLRENYAQLTQSKQSQANAQRAPDDAALAAGADIRWRQWVDQRQAAINAELAQLLAQKESCKQRLKIAFGRDQAVTGLQEHHEGLQRRLLRRKANYES
jgi:hypothetical protein